MPDTKSDKAGTALKVLDLWIRPVEGGELVQQEVLNLEAGRGVVGDHTFGRMRHLTIIFEADWREAERDLGRKVDPRGRRANVLVTGGPAPRFVGTNLQLGEAVLEIKGITSPCPIMDAAAEGLTEALKPEGRGGVWGRVIQGGAIRRGDALQLIEDSTGVDL